MYSLIFTTLLTIKNRSLFYCTIFETKKLQFINLYKHNVNLREYGLSTLISIIF